MPKHRKKNPPDPPKPFNPLPLPKLSLSKPWNLSLLPSKGLCNKVKLLLSKLNPSP